MAQIDLYDLLKLEAADIDRTGKSGIIVKIVNAGGLQADITDSIPTGSNLITGAVTEFCRATGISGEFVFSLEKNIPAGAGLGGGSSDAAAALRLVSDYTGAGREGLSKVASLVGADVPFQLAGGCAICEGIGEIVEPLNGRLTHKVVMANNGIHVNTALAYKMLNRNESYSGKSGNIDEVRDMIRSSVASGVIDKVKGFLFNDFEPVVFGQYPELEALKNKFMDYGADFSLMTGSGSTIIGVFSSEKSAVDAANYLKHSVRHVMVASFV